MNDDNQLILFNFLMLLESLEAYIEKSGHFPNFTRQLRNITIPKEVEKRCSSVNLEKVFKTKLLLFFGILGGNASDSLRKEIQTKYYRWINATRINTDNWPDQKLSHFFLETMDIIEKSSEKIFNKTEEYLYKKKHKDPFDPEKASKLFSQVGNIMSNPLQLPSPDTIKGNAEAGKETFQKIASSVLDSDRQNFHFYPPLTDEERTEMKKKEQEENQNDPILEGLKINAIAEIKSTLNSTPSITNSELSNENQNWEEKIKEGQKIIEIENIKWQVLADIQRVREGKQLSEITPSPNSYKPWIILGIIGLVLISLIIWLETRKKKR